MNSSKGLVLLPAIPERTALAGVRRAIDVIDDALVVLLAGRGALVGSAAAIKRDIGRPGP